jgi:hypothetical protein
MAGEVGDFVLMNASGVECGAGFEIKVGGGVVVGDKVGVIACAARDEFAAEAGVVIDFEHVDADVRDTGGYGFGEGVAPGLDRLMRESGDEVNTDFEDSGGAKVGDVGESDVTCVEASDGA